MSRQAILTPKALRCVLTLLTVAACVVLVVARDDAGGKLGQAQQEYERHNYKRAMALCEEIIADEPGEPELKQAKRLRALSMCRLRDQNGYVYARELMVEYEGLAHDAELWEAMGYDRERHWPRKQAYEAYRKAGEFYEKAEQDTRAADAYFKAAEMLGTSYDIIPSPQQQAGEPRREPNWQERRKQHIEETLKLYDHITALEVDDERKARALRLGGERAAREGEWEIVEKGLEFLRRCVKDYPKTVHAPRAQFHIGATLERFGRFVQAVEEYRKVFGDFPGAKDWAERAKDRVEEIRAPRISIGVTKSFLPGEKPEVYWSIRNVRKLHLTARAIDLTALVGSLKRVDDAGEALAKAPGQNVKAWTFDTPDKGEHQFHQVEPGDEEHPSPAPLAVPLAEQGAYVVTARGTNPDGTETSDHCLVMISNLAAVAKTDADQALVFAADADSGAPAGGADVSVARRWGRRNNRWLTDHAAGKTNDAGVADLKMPKRRSCSWIAAVKRGADQAVCARGSFYWSWWGYGQPYKVYGFTERPVYRPKQTVHFKQIVRKHQEGVYTNVPNQKVRVTIVNPKGETVYAKDLVTDEFGAVEGDVPIGEEPPLGVYRIEVRVAHGSGGWQSVPSAGNRFRVEEYKKPEYEVTVSPAKPDYRVGDEMKIKIGARYYFGQPVVGGEVKFTIEKQSYSHRFEWPREWEWYYEEVYYGWRYGRWRPWWRPQFSELVARGSAKTDGNGEAFVTVKAEPIKNHEELDLKFVVKAEVTDASRRVIRSEGAVKVTHAPYFVYLDPAQRVHGPGDSVEVNIRTENPNGQPVAGEFTVKAEVIRRVEKKRKDADGNEKVVHEDEVVQALNLGPAAKATVPETGRASVRFVPDVTGRIRVTVAEANPKQGMKPVEGRCELWIASKTGAEAHYAYNDLQVIPAKDQYEIGETFKLLVNTSKTNSRVLITFEADDLLLHRVIHVEKNSKLVEFPVDKSLCPNFALTATMLREGKLFADTKQIIVPPTHQFLKVEVGVGEGDLGGGRDSKYQPREKAKVKVKLTDVRTGRPAVGQVALMMVDASIYYIQPEFRQAVEKAFYGFVRRVRVATANSYAGPPSLTPWRRHYPGHIAYRNGAPMPLAARPAEGAPAMEADMAMPARSRRMAKGGEGAGPPLAEAVVRKEFRDTVLWAGSVVTDADGTAEVPVTMPDQLTTFALHAIAADKDTRVGQTRTDVITTKRIIVRLQSGRFFTEGDHSYVTVIAHNYYDEPQDLKVDLAVDDEDGRLALRQVKLDGRWRDYASGEALDVTVPAGGEARIDFKTTAERPGEVKLLARARGVRESDALQLTKPIVPWGAGRILSDSGSMRGGQDQSVEIKLTVPEQIKEGSQELTVTLNPSIAAVAMEALPYLAAYPYGCTEQTMSRFLPTVVMRKTLQNSGVDLDDIRKFIEDQIRKDPKLAGRWKLINDRVRKNPVYSAAEVDKMIDAGLKRLASFQHGDGGWGWWKHGESDPYMTSYVAFGLSVARDCDVKLPAGMIEKAAKFLIARAARPKVGDDAGWWWRHVDSDATRTFMLYVIGRLDAAALRNNAKLKAELRRLFEDRDELGDYGRALLAITLKAAGRDADAKIVVENFDNTAVVDADKGMVHWGQVDGWWYWYHGATETTAWCLQAMMAVDPDNEKVPMAVEWLVHNRRRLYWYNTKCTAMVVHALATYARQAGELDPDQTYEVRIDGQVSRTVRVTKENLFTFDDRLVVGPQGLTPGEHTVTIRRTGKGSLYYGAHLTFFDKSEVIEASGNRLALKREYFRLVPEEFENTRRVWKDGKVVEEKFPDLRYRPEPLKFGAEIASGEMVEVKLSIKADNNFEYVLFEDPKPSGCEPYRLVSGSAYGGGTYANMELRDTRIVFFASWLREGDSSLSYKLVCEQPGTFRVIPTHGEAMYSPFVQANSGSGKLVITEKPEN